MIQSPDIMKKALLLFAIIVSCLSCRKDFLIPNGEVPGWLKDKISQNEATIKSDPKLMPNYGAWIRYEYQGEKYYEYDNPLSCAISNPWSEAGEQINTSISPYTNYWNDKCCEMFVWKAPEYHKY
jgi:hypothetical protein